MVELRIAPRSGDSACSRNPDRGPGENPLADIRVIHRSRQFQYEILPNRKHFLAPPTSLSLDGPETA